MRRIQVMLGVALAVGVTVGVLGGRLLSAQDPLASGTVLQRTELISAPGMEAILVLRELFLGIRRFNDMRLELGAQQELTTFEGRTWLVTWAALPDQVFFLNLGAIERGVVRPLSIDERVNMAWIPGQDAFTVLMKYYGENVGRYLNQSAKITNLTLPTY